MKPLRDAKAFVCAPAYDTPGRKDSSGAFQPEAKRLIRALDLRASLRLFDSNRALPERRSEVRPALTQQTDLDLAAFLCHGWRDGVQAGWRSHQAGDLAAALVGACKPDAVIALYCCDTGSGTGDGAPGGKGGFASTLYGCLLALGFRGTLWAHSTTGHTTQNPYVRVWRPDEEPELGDWACEPHSEHWSKWTKAVRETEWRYRMLQYVMCEELEAAIEKLP
jgi:hypothetical protein